MPKTKHGKSSRFVFKGYMLSIIFFVIIFVMFLWGIGNAESSSNAEGKQVLEDSIRRAAVSCYAIEGRYPQDLKYLEDNYGIVIDKDRYVVSYNVVFANIMPEITVFDMKSAYNNDNAGGADENFDMDNIDPGETEEAPQP